MPASYLGTNRAPDEVLTWRQCRPDRIEELFIRPALRFENSSNGSQLPSGPGLERCEQCDTLIPEARRKAIPGVRLCVPCQEAHDAEEAGFSGYNRRGSKDSQLR